MSVRSRVTRSTLTKRITHKAQRPVGNHFRPSSSSQQGQLKLNPEIIKLSDGDRKTIFKQYWLAQWTFPTKSNSYPNRIIKTDDSERNPVALTVFNPVRGKRKQLI